MEATKRLFIGTFLSETGRYQFQQLREDLEPVLAENWNCKLRWVRPEKLHMTWLFIGDCSHEQEEAIASTLLKVTEELSLTETDSVISFEKLDFFPNKSKRSLMALLPTTIPTGFAEVASHLRKDLEKFCQKYEGLKLRPHITLFRFDRTDRNNYSFPQNFDKSRIAKIQLNVSKLSLVSSHLGSNKESYEELQVFEFKRDQS